MPKDARDRTPFRSRTAARERYTDEPREDPASHPLGTGAGAGAGAAIGGVIGSVAAGPAGAAAGTALGALAGGMAGKAAAEGVNPTDEDRYWRDHYRHRPYADDTLSYDHYRPAYRYGWEARTRYDGRRWNEVERELERGWRENRGASRLGWGDAKLAARDAWLRVDNRMLDAREERSRGEAAAEPQDPGAADPGTGAVPQDEA